MALNLRTRIGDLIRPSFWAGMITLTKAVAHLIILKFAATTFGPSLVGIVGQTMGLVSILQAFSGGGINNGVIRNFSLHFNDIKKRDEFVSGSFTYGLFFCAVTLLICVVFPKYLAEVTFGDTGFYVVFLAIGALNIFSFLGSFIQSILTAQTQVKRIFCIQLFAWCCAIPAFISLSKSYQTPGAIAGTFAIVLFQALFFLFSLRKHGCHPGFKWRLHVNPEIAKILLPFTMVTLATGLVGPSILLLLRSRIEDGLGWSGVGYWQSMTKISEICFSFLSMVIASTYFPKVSKIIDGPSAVRETWRFLARFIPPLIALFLLLGAMGKYLLTGIFTAEFGHLEGNLRVLLAGDFFRAIGWVFSYLLMARNRLYTLLVLELIMSLLLYAFGVYGLSLGLKGLVAMQAMHSLLYCISLIFLCLWIVRRDRENQVL